VGHRLCARSRLVRHASRDLRWTRRRGDLAAARAADRLRLGRHRPVRTADGHHPRPDRPGLDGAARRRWGAREHGAGDGRRPGRPDAGAAAARPGPRGSARSSAAWCPAAA